ncbi:hypothetical protein M427DRAFT_150921 [Gonapodya prolifera JEL478]|uniref:Flavodoxin-like domain-containing protein n=1 Tax=Gonapodya prolifera (strain JEL478) TaxID=1344416 RepID=A0A139AXY4_GONPJ|nr:hypothetical protein M427DRAFT_150921 [Gonapodya prolifera JEL478]|eukprot:KXS21579.1 hypothetical protein M427DRAFT_150921 [Gonapodya prolifera JEL478]
MSSNPEHVAIIYASKSGGTVRLAKHLADGLQLSHPEYGTSELFNIEGGLPADFNWKRYKALALAIPFYNNDGASSKITSFLSHNLSRINNIPHALLVISMSPLGKGYSQENDRGLKSFLRATGLKPRIVKVVPGHIPWSKFSLVDKIRVKKVLSSVDDLGWNPKYVKAGDDPSDPKKGDREYTNLNEIDDFARDFVVEAQEHYEAKSSREDLFATKGRNLFATASEDD